MKVIFKLEHIRTHLHNQSQCWPLKTDTTKWKVVAWSGNFKSYFQVSWLSDYCPKLLRVALFILNPLFLQNWRFSYLFLHALSLAAFPSSGSPFICYFLGVGRDISFHIYWKVLSVLSDPSTPFYSFCLG